MPDDVTLRLSVNMLHELIQRAETQNYMLVKGVGPDGYIQWVRITPHLPESEH